MPGGVKDGVGRDEHERRRRHLHLGQSRFQVGDPRRLSGLARGIGGNGGLGRGLLAEEPGADAARVG